MGICAVFVVTSAINEEFAEVGNVEPLLDVLFRCRKVAVKLAGKLAWFFGLILA